MLWINRIQSFYGNIQVLFDLSMVIHKGKVTTLMGRNGMGKTTTVNTILGLVRCQSGEIHFNETLIHNLPPHLIAQQGIGLVPEGRQIFPNLTVRENLVAFSANFSGISQPWDIDRVLDLFPPLKPRLQNMGSHLSGGEQQMLAIGRALMLNPKLLILDEATEGLAPLVRKQIWQRLNELKKTGLSIMLIDKNLDDLINIADRHYIIEKGKIVWQGDSQQLTADATLRFRYLGI